MTKPALKSAKKTHKKSASFALRDDEELLKKPAEIEGNNDAVQPEGSQGKSDFGKEL